MGHIRRHIPRFCTGVDEKDKEFDFSGLSELLALPFVKNFSAWPNFYRYSTSKGNLMAEYDAGKTCYVVGRLSDADDIDLPEWCQSQESIEAT